MCLSQNGTSVTVIILPLTAFFHWRRIYFLQGADVFDAEICLEVQWIDELAIAALERCGSVVSSRFYDPRALQALSNPKKFV